MNCTHLSPNILNSSLNAPHLKHDKFFYVIVGTFLRIVGDHSCFYIDPESGWIHVRANLRTSPCTANSYTFDVIAEDSNTPPRQSNRVRVTMEIRRFLDPTFSNLPFNVSIGKSVKLSRKVFSFCDCDLWNEMFEKLQLFYITKPYSVRGTLVDVTHIGTFWTKIKKFFLNIP